MDDLHVVVLSTVLSDWVLWAWIPVLFSVSPASVRFHSIFLCEWTVTWEQHFTCISHHKEIWWVPETHFSLTLYMVWVHRNLWVCSVSFVGARPHHLQQLLFVLHFFSGQCRIFWVCCCCFKTLSWLRDTSSISVLVTIKFQQFCEDLSLEQEFDCTDSCCWVWCAFVCKEKSSWPWAWAILIAFKSVQFGIQLCHLFVATTTLHKYVGCCLCSWMIWAKT